MRTVAPGVCPNSRQRPQGLSGVRCPSAALTTQDHEPARTCPRLQRNAWASSPSRSWNGMAVLRISSGSPDRRARALFARGEWRAFPRSCLVNRPRSAGGTRVINAHKRAMAAMTLRASATPFFGRRAPSRDSYYTRASANRFEHTTHRRCPHFEARSDFDRPNLALGRLRAVMAFS